jgi:hypothetical protein
MTSKHTNSGKKEQRQINQLLTKSVNEDDKRGKTDIEARTTPQQQKLKKGPRAGG